MPVASRMTLEDAFACVSLNATATRRSGKVVVTTPAAPCPRQLSVTRVWWKSHSGSQEHLPVAVLPRPEAGLAELDALLQTARLTRGGRSPPPAAACPRPRLPRKPGSSESTGPRRRPEPHWACSALAGSGACRWKLRLPAAGLGTRNEKRRGRRRRLVRARCCRAPRVAMASSARRPPEWRSGVRSVRALGGRAWAAGYGRREPRAGFVVSGRRSCRTFRRLGWWRLRAWRCPALPARGWWQDAGNICRAGTGGLGTAASQARATTF